VEQYFPEELAQEVRNGSNNLYFWGQHYVLRIVASLIATGCGGAVAGTIGRQHGKQAAALSALPSVALWLWAAVATFQVHPNQYLPPGSRYVALALALLSIPVAMLSGNAGAEQGSRLAGHFDGRCHSILGVKWIHYLWLVPVAYVALALSTWSVLYFGQLEFHLSQGGVPTFVWEQASRNGIFRMLGGVLAACVLGSIYLMVGGLSHAYLALAGLSKNVNRNVVIRRGCGLPLLGAILQAACNAALIGLAKLFG
jgi:hypothetical protein